MAPACGFAAACGCGAPRRPSPRTRVGRRKPPRPLAARSMLPAPTRSNARQRHAGRRGDAPEQPVATLACSFARARAATTDEGCAALVASLSIRAPRQRGRNATPSLIGASSTWTPAPTSRRERARERQFRFRHGSGADIAPAQLIRRAGRQRRGALSTLRVSCGSHRRRQCSAAGYGFVPKSLGSGTFESLLRSRGTFFAPSSPFAPFLAILRLRRRDRP